MTTERQRQANKANAQRSSGPRSAEGKRKVSQNARRHGLTTPLPWDQVTGWYRIILGDGAARPDFASREPRTQAALRLAEAEAHLARVVQAELDHLFEMQTRLQQDATDMPRLDRILARLSGDPAQAKGARLLARVSPTRPEAMRRTLKTLTRYRREAEGARKIALNDWIKLSS
tara:strand:- start:3539 stop:4060 length:522 start_codon:yes stop_codon:yes gene_type:complete